MQLVIRALSDRRNRDSVCAWLCSYNELYYESTTHDFSFDLLVDSVGRFHSSNYGFLSQFT